MMLKLCDLSFSPLKGEKRLSANVPDCICSRRGGEGNRGIRLNRDTGVWSWRLLVTCRAVLSDCKRLAFLLDD